ncbi:hypothetical protein WISP_103920 [Willisornis vidua]|uniref:Uncharacterized protein n=1 Tax=Willisornis vidua TaxID=1566151 RepID=A0ABQ9D320_9PASS|nr:hypothetical protein WISP_103920 [Willisornis vidua]
MAAHLEQDGSTAPIPMTAEEEGTCQKEAAKAAEEEEQSHPSPVSAVALTSLIQAMQSLTVCPPGNCVQPRDISLPGSSWSSELDGCPPVRGIAQRRFPRLPKRKPPPLGRKCGNQRCKTRRRRKRGRSIKPCILRAIANTQATTSSTQLWAHQQRNLRTFIAEK